MDTSYHRYTEMDKEPGGLRRLDLTADALQSHQRATAKPSLRVLDVGCGNGQIGIPLASLGYEVVGIDLDPHSVAVARESSPFDNATFLVQDALALEVEGPFDAVVCCEIIEHLPEPSLLLESVSAILEDDGVLLVTIPNGYTVEQIVRRFLTTTRLGVPLGEILKRWLLSDQTVQTENIDSPHLQYFTLRSFRSLLDRGRLQITEEANWTAFFLTLYYIFLRLFVKRGSPLFRTLDRWDATLAESLPLQAGAGWFFVVKRKPESNLET